MKNQDTDARLKKAKEEIERLRNENHNLKRRIKRLKNKQLENSSVTQVVNNEKDIRMNEVRAESIDEIKKKLKANGMTGRTMEVMEWFLSEVIGSQKK